MRRDKLIERAQKLLAMSCDSGSPAEAAIAERRLNALMGKYDISFAEIKRFERSSDVRKNSRSAATVRRRRSSPSVQRKQPQTARHPNRKRALVALCGFVVALGVWLFYGGFVEIKLPLIDAVSELQVERPRGEQTSSLTAQVDRTTVIDGESVVLLITGSGVSTVPNTSSLWQDFQIIGTEMKEAHDTQSFRLRLMLQPRRAGTVVIPSFRVDEVRSEHIVLDVLRRS